MPAPDRRIYTRAYAGRGCDFLIQQGRLVAANEEGVVVRNSGHWLMEEAPDQVIPKLVEFLDR